MLPPMNRCMLPASTNTRWILHRLSFGGAPAYSASAPNPVGFTLTGEAQMFVSRLHAYGFAVKNNMRRTTFKMFAFISPLKSVGVPARPLLMTDGVIDFSTGQEVTGGILAQVI